MAMLGAPALMHQVLRRRILAASLVLVTAASLTAIPGAAGQSLDWVRNPSTGHWYAVVHDMTWPEGEAYAVSIGGHLATINDEAEDRWIAATFQAETLAGLNDIAREGTWVWASGEPVTYTNWVPGTPVDGTGPDVGDVLHLNKDESGAFGWLIADIDDQIEGQLFPLLIEVVSDMAPPAEMPTPTPAAVSLEWVRNPATGHWYAVVHDMTWFEGEACAIRLGGHLATVNDEAEDRWISATFQEGMLAGLNDLQQEGQWVWASGEPVTYINWLPGQPDDGGGLNAEDVVHLELGSSGWTDEPPTFRNEEGTVALLIEVVSGVAPPSTLPIALPSPTPTPQPTAVPTVSPTVAPSPTISPIPSALPSTAPSPSPQPTIVVIVIGGGGSGAGYRPADPSVPGITRYIPTPGDLSIDPSVLWTNLLLAGVVMVMLILATELLNRSLGELEPVLSGRFAIIRRLQRGMTRLNAATLQRLAARRHRLVDVARLAAIAAFYGVVFALLDPTWDPLSLAGLWLVVMMALAAGIVGLGGDICAWAVGRRWGVAGDLEIRAGSLLAAVGSTLVSRALVIVPGVMIGSPEVIEVDPERVDRRRLGIIAAVGMGTVLLIGLVAWALTLATSAMRGSAGSLETALAAAEAFLLLVFAFAIQNAFVQLLSLRQSGGLALRRTHPVWWGAALLLVSFAFWQTLVNPSGDLASALHNRNALVFLAAAGLVLFVSLAVWVGTRLTWLRVAEPGDSAAVRAIDLQRTFTLGPKALAEKLGIDTGLAKALRWQLDIEHDPVCRHDFVFGRMKVPMYSNRALERMRDAIAGGTNLSEVRRAYQAAGRP